jgi:NAD-dependent deacetylase
MKMAKTHPNFQSIVVLTGAGISAESGIRTFRASDGLWENHRIEDVASPEGFTRDPETVHHFYNLRRNQLLSHSVQPNLAHIALAEFEQRFMDDSDPRSARQFTLITQNIDDLHERSGSKSLLHMHGELLKIRCSETNQIFPCHKDTFTNSLCQCCLKPGNLRPHVVWFGEMPLCLDDIYLALEQCDLFIAIGTSGNVYPAAGFFEIAKSVNAHTVELNLEPSTNGSRFDEKIYGQATKIVPAYFNRLLSATG